MSGWLNLCQFIGNVGKDAEVRYGPDGGAVAKISVAVTEEWKDKSGEKKERTTWVSVVCFGKLGEIVGQYVKKGAKVYVQGRFSVRDYKKDGETKYVTEIIGDKVLMLDKKPFDESAPQREAQRPAEKQQDAPSKPAASRFDDFESDIPF